ncbi:hypothetical protein OnM2_072046 [Erysiphe neolycopersici]|uniref:Uncharacterized protein n=1 Tax=Erysiphe neolycopersici TaxID=212602 RepID=A0A420HJV9_9PEZI|nr:hypothetical protein OnM2_072046 [Erysiphe neolycopersici]
MAEAFQSLNFDDNDDDVPDSASYHSVDSYDQYLALSKRLILKSNKNTAGFVIASFGKGCASSVDSIDLSALLIYQFLPEHLNFYELPADILFLLSLYDIDHAKIMFNNLRNILRQPDSGIKMPVHLYRGHA